MNFSLNSKYFEILSHPIRFAILKSLDIRMRNFSEILKDVDPDEEIGSSKLNFHLKKLVDMNILTKEDKAYSLSELGLKLLTVIQNFSFDDDQQSEESQKVSDTVEEENFVVKNNIIISKKKDLPIIKRPDNLPLIVSAFEYYEGKNYEFMEENYTLLLPDPIENKIKPKDWIKDFSESIYPLLNHNKSREWLIDRYLKLGYGTRGLQDYGLMDASVSVPPYKTTFDAIVELLSTRGKAGLYAKTGMGKSRTALYIASHWFRSYKTPVLYIQNPNFLNDTDFKNLEEFLRKNIVKTRSDPKILLIIEDAHLVDNNQMDSVRKLIAGANNKTYAIFLSFTDIQILKEETKGLNTNFEQIEYLKKELIPQEFSKILDLNQQWKLLRPYFFEWLKWVATDILFDLLPSSTIREKTEIFLSPWSFVVSLGFLEHSLKELLTHVESNLPIILYYSLGQIYIMRGERGIDLNNLLSMFKNYYNKELVGLIGLEWEKYFISLLNSWTLPDNRLLPPFQQVQNERFLSKDTLINFYHIEWAYKACEDLDGLNKEGKIDFTSLFKQLFPVLFEIWEFSNNNGLSLKSFLFWLRNSIRFDINLEGEIRITSFKVDSQTKKLLNMFELSSEKLKNARPSEMVNWLFIKSVISA